MRLLPSVFFVRMPTPKRGQSTVYVEWPRLRSLRLRFLG